VNARIQWIEEGPSLQSVFQSLGEVVQQHKSTLGATASNPAQYVDCNIAAPSAAGQGIVKRLQALLQREVPGAGVLQTGFLDAETCAAWRDYTADKPWMKAYPGNFNITNILDTLDGASVDPSTGRVVHHWRCNGPMVTPDCTQVPARAGEVDTCPEGTERDPTTKKCVPSEPCPPGQERDENGVCAPIKCPDGQQFDLTSGRCVPTPKTSAKKKSNKGLLLLASAAAAAIAIATQM